MVKDLLSVFTATSEMIPVIRVQAPLLTQLPYLFFRQAIHSLHSPIPLILV